MTVFSCGTRKTLLNLPSPWDGSESPSRAIHGCYALYGTIIARRTLCTREPVFSTRATPVRTERAIHRGGGGKRTVLASRTWDAVCHLSSALSRPVCSGKTAGRDHCALRAELARGADVTGGELCAAGGVPEVTRGTRSGKRARNWTVSSRVARLTVGVLRATSPIVVGTCRTAGRVHRPFRTETSGRTDHAFLLGGGTDGISVCTSGTRGRDGARDRTV